MLNSNSTQLTWKTVTILKNSTRRPHRHTERHERQRFVQR